MLGPGDGRLREWVTPRWERAAFVRERVKGVERSGLGAERLGPPARPSHVDAAGGTFGTDEGRNRESGIRVGLRLLRPTAHHRYIGQTRMTSNHG